MFTQILRREPRSFLPFLVEQPVVIDKATCNKLLDNLVESFNNKLDEKYGPLQKAPNLRAASNPSHHSAYPYIDSHLSSIITNPLFRYQTKTAHDRNPKALLPQARKSKRYDVNASNPVTELFKRDPMDVFDEAVSKGLMTMKHATGCLIAKHKHMAQTEAHLLVPKSMTLGVTSRVLSWLQASGRLRTPKFLYGNMTFVDALLPFMVYEGMDNIVWEWFRWLLKQAQDMLAHKAATDLIVAFVCVNTKKAREYRPAPYELVLRIQQEFMNITGKATDTMRGETLQNNPVFCSWKHLSIHGTMSASVLAPPPIVTFNEFLALSDAWGELVKIDRAHLNLHHPIDPTPDKAVELMVEKPVMLEPPQTESAGDQLQVLRFAQIGIDAIRFFLCRGRKEQAEAVYAELLRALPWVPWHKYKISRSIV